MHADPYLQRQAVNLEGRSILARDATDPSVKVAVAPLVPDADVPGWWEPLFGASCNATVFLSAEWMQSWLEVYGGDFHGLWIRWEHAGRTVAGCLLLSRMVWKRCIPFKSLYLNATGEASERTPLAEFNDVLHLDGYADVVAADLARLVNEMSWDRLLLSGYEKHGLLNKAIPMIPSALVQTEPRHAPYVDFSSLSAGAFETTLTGKIGCRIRRNIGLFHEKFGQLEVASASSLEESMQYFYNLSILHNARWQAKGQGGSFESAAVVDFHQRLIRRLWPKQGVDLVCVSGGPSALGYLYNFTSENKVYVFQTGFEYGDDPRLSPGLLTHSLSIEHYRKRGFREYDLLAGDAAYKRALAKQARTLHWSVAYRKRSWIHFVLWLRRMKAGLASRPVESACRS